MCGCICMCVHTCMRQGVALFICLTINLLPLISANCNVRISMNWPFKKHLQQTQNGIASHEMATRIMRVFSKGTGPGKGGSPWRYCTEKWPEKKNENCKGFFNTTRNVHAILICIITYSITQSLLPRFQPSTYCDQIDFAQLPNFQTNNIIYICIYPCMDIANGWVTYYSVCQTFEYGTLVHLVWVLYLTDKPTSQTWTVNTLRL